MFFKSFKLNFLDSARTVDSTKFFDLIAKYPSFGDKWKELCTKSGDTVVHLAAHSGCVDIIQYFGELGSKTILEQKNLDGKTPLHVASHSSQLQCVKYLLSCNVCVDSLKRSDWTPLMLACTKSNLEIVKELITHGANLHTSNKDGWTAFHIASREGNAEIIKHLFECDTSIWNTKSKNGRTPLHTASLHGRLAVVEVFVDRANYYVDVKDSCGTTPLMDAVSANHTHVVEFLIQGGASIEETDKLGRNVLHIASESGNHDCIKLFVQKYHICIDSQTTHLLTALHFACKENNLKSVELLLKLGANYSIKDSGGRAALEYTSKEEVRNYLLSISKK